ncbi:hypothetical protein [Rhodosalinus sp. K401]|uniref:hypothetical protein n=1 Tax=Rhodosalinus sp. K401 TaxID=3239195 RepID=UPI0035256406
MGICYPETGRGGGAAHHDLSRALKGMPAERLGLPAAWREAFLAEAESCPTCLVSSEDFATMPDPAMAATLFPPGETRVVVYVREHVRHLLSWYQQAIHSRAVCLDFAEFARHYRKNFHTILSRWADVYGRSNIVARPYDRTLFPDGDIFNDFTVNALPDAGNIVRSAPAEANPSLAGNLLFLKLLLNITLGEQSSQERVLSESLALASLDPSFRGVFPASAETVARLRSHARRDRDALARDFDIALRPPKGAIEGPASPDLSRLRADIDLIRSEAVKRNFQIVPLIDRLLAGFAPGG